MEAEGFADFGFAGGANLGSGAFIGADDLFFSAGFATFCGLDFFLFLAMGNFGDEQN
jgi:hypothetical protein